jgi:hypothetical protein
MKSRNVHLNLKKIAMRMAADLKTVQADWWYRELGESLDAQVSRIEIGLRSDRLRHTDSSFRKLYARWL